jgi:ribosome-associated protein
MHVTETKKTKSKPRATTTTKKRATARKVAKPIEPPKPAEVENNALLDLAHGIVEAISDKLGEKIVLMDLRQQTPFTDYFVVCSANSERQIKAIYDGVRDHTIKHFSAKPRRIEGSTDSGWVLMDYSGIVVHIFSPTQRQFYQLEDLWKESPVVLKMQ